MYKIDNVLNNTIYARKLVKKYLLRLYFLVL